MPKVKWMCIGTLIVLSVVEAKQFKTAKNETVEIPTIADILVDFMADYAEKRLSNRVTPSSNGNYYDGRYYWLGDRYYRNNNPNVIECNFTTPPRFSFVYADTGTPVKEIIFECNDTLICCDAGCCPNNTESKTPKGTKGGTKVAVTTAAPSSSGGGYSMTSLIGIGVGVMLLVAALCTICICCWCSRLGKKKGKAAPKKAPSLKPGYGTIAKFALKSKMGGR